MADTQKKRSKSKKPDLERFAQAEENLRRIQETIAPYVKKRPFAMRSTTGRWCASPAQCVDNTPDDAGLSDAAGGSSSRTSVK